MNNREMIEARCEQQGLRILSWSDTEDGETALLGKFVVTTDEEEDYGLYVDDEGILTACVVGAEQYGNRRVCFSFITEGRDCGEEVHDLSALDRIDD